MACEKRQQRDCTATIDSDQPAYALISDLCTGVMEILGGENI